MEINVEQVVEKVLNNISEKVKGLASTDTIIGDEFTMGEYTCKPVMKAGMGFGTGVGNGTQHFKHKGKGSGVGTGAGVGVQPVGFLITKGDEISFIPAGNGKGLSAIIDKIPDIIEKCNDWKEKKEAGETDKKEKAK